MLKSWKRRCTLKPSVGLPWLAQCGHGLVGFVFLFAWACQPNAQDHGTGEQKKLASNPAAASGEKPPHVVVVVADDLGWADVGYHNDEIQTPQIDRLAEEGLILERMYAQPICSPSRAAFMTGRSPMRMGLIYTPIKPWQKAGLPAEEVTLAEVFQQAGYQTACIGKWHLGHASKRQWPTARGFDFFYGCLTGAVDYQSHERNGGLDWQRNGESVRENGYATHLLAREAVRLLENHQGDRPLFLYLPFTAPHSPLQAPAKAVEAYPELTGRRKTYAAMVSELDRAVGEIRTALERKNMMQSTCILFLSDNGASRQFGGRNRPLRGAKSTPWEGGIRVPAVLHWPAKLKAGQRTQQILSLEDWLPTLAAMAGASTAECLELDGENLWPALQGNRIQKRKPIFFAGEESKHRRQAVIHEPWKFVREIVKESGEVRRHLFDLKQDPSERKNLFQDFPAEAKRLEELLDTWAALHPEDGADYQPDMPQGWRPPKDWAKAASE
ncbi:MAG: arylsulfatase [Planctomycetota bacterium]|nr:MAG: arylsulfatase [Planctomycetota bacterium]